MEDSCRIGRTWSETWSFSKLSSSPLTYPVLHETLTPSRVMPTWKNLATSLLLYQTSLLQAQTITSFSSNPWGRQVWQNTAPLLSWTWSWSLLLEKHKPSHCHINPPLTGAVSSFHSHKPLTALHPLGTSVLSQPDVCPWQKVPSQPLCCCCSSGASVCVSCVFWFLSPQ